MASDERFYLLLTDNGEQPFMNADKRLIPNIRA